MRQIKLVILMVGLFCVTGIHAQDFHFSQFNSSPLMSNPANTGMFRGKYRSFLNYKEQWRSVTTPFVTYAASGDMVIRKKTNNSNFGLGALIIKDQAGAIKLSKTSVNLSFSGIVKMDELNVVSLGIQSGFVQNSFDPSGLRWGNQFDGTGYNESMDPKEEFGAASYFAPDFAVGVVYSYNNFEQKIMSNDELRFSTGLAMHHVARPKTSTTKDDKVWRRYNFFMDGIYSIKNTPHAIQGIYMIQKQGPSYENLFGFMWRYNMKHGSHYTGVYKGSDLKVGSYYRWKDAVSPYIGLELNGFGFGVSYDINISDLKTASKMKGGVEVNLNMILASGNNKSVSIR